MADFHIYADKAALIVGAAEFIATNAVRNIAQKGSFSLVLSGGSTPQPIYERLTQALFRAKIDWSKVYLFWGDERTVPPDHEDSNYRMVQEALIDHIPIPESQIFRMHGEKNPQEAAQVYADVLKRYFQASAPIFDLVLLGMGDDGHTASLFPYTDALNNQDDWVVANYVEKLDTWRLTLTSTVINQARRIAFLVSGANKAKPLYEVLHGQSNAEQYPSQLIRATDWFLDQDAAQLLP